MDQHITWREGEAPTAEQAIAEYVRAGTVEKVAEMRREAAAWLARAAKLESDTDDMKRFWSWPFRDALEGGVYMASSGTWLDTCERAAQHLANATKQMVRFSHNDWVRTVEPEKGTAPR